MLFAFSINHWLLQILPSDWLSYSPCIGDRQQVAKWIDFQIQAMAENSSFAKVSIRFFKITVCPTILALADYLLIDNSGSFINCQLWLQNILKCQHYEGTFVNKRGTWLFYKCWSRCLGGPPVLKPLNVMKELRIFACIQYVKYVICYQLVWLITDDGARYYAEAGPSNFFRI